jgi:hypothetical protein
MSAIAPPPIPGVDDEARDVRRESARALETLRASSPSLEEDAPTPRGPLGLRTWLSLGALAMLGALAARRLARR